MIYVRWGESTAPPSLTFDPRLLLPNEPWTTRLTAWGSPDDDGAHRSDSEWWRRRDGILGSPMHPRQTLPSSPSGRRGRSANDAPLLRLGDRRRPCDSNPGRRPRRRSRRRAFGLRTRRPPSAIIVAFAVAVAVAVAAVGREVQHRATAGRVPPGDDPRQVLPVRRAMKASRLDMAWRYYHTVPTAFP